jgi:hypothetical protein
LSPALIELAMALRIPSCVEAGSVLSVLPSLYGDFVLLHGERTLFVTKGEHL